MKFRAAQHFGLHSALIAVGCLSARHGTGVRTRINAEVKFSVRAVIASLSCWRWLRKAEASGGEKLASTRKRTLTSRQSDKSFSAATLTRYQLSSLLLARLYQFSSMPVRTLESRGLHQGTVAICHHFRSQPPAKASYEKLCTLQIWQDVRNSRGVSNRTAGTGPVGTTDKYAFC